MSIEDFLSNFDVYSARGGDYKVLCPAHADRNPSLSVTERDGKLLLFCHAGCSTDDVLAALGMTYKDIGSGHDVPEAVYEYTDEQGETLYEVVRFPGKRFMQRHVEPETGERVWGLNGTRRVLYRLPEVLAGIRDGKTIYICEGEKDADALRALGKVATTTTGGAQSWKDEYAQTFLGARVIIVQDKDDPGRKRAKQIHESLGGIARSRWIVQAREGKDVSDHLAAGLAVEDMEEVSPEQQDKPPIMSVRHFAASVPEYDESKDYVGPFIHGGYRIHVAGPTGHGKTSLLLEAESAALRGTEFLSWAGKGGLRALHVDLEMPGELLLQAVKDARLDGVEGFDLWHEPDGLEIDTNETHRRMLEKAVAGYHIVVIDPWYKLLAQEGEYASIRRVIGLLDGLRKRHPEMCLLVGCHTHEVYNTKDRLGIAHIRGFKVFHNPADIVLTFQRIKGDTSRVVWAKNRSPRLDVKINDEWMLDWTRGQGFQRVHELGDDHIPGVF